MASELPIVGITLGDVAGIGPEVVVKALHHSELHKRCRPLVIGDSRVFSDPKFAASAEQVHSITSLKAAAFEPGEITVLDLHNLDPTIVTVGEVSAVAGRAAVEYVLKAADLARSGQIDAIATAPLNKEAMRLAGYDYIGHTEILMDVTHTEHCTTMLATEGLRVTHVTRHIPFREIADRITMANVLETIMVTEEGMRRLGYAKPRVAVAGLNPHNGENGLLGREELDEIAPAVEAARSHGIDAHGPLPADSVFFQAIGGAYDVVVCMYHDQGHIAVKTQGFERSITITLGLPILRTSADHGTAFDIAGRGIAHESSMLTAILEAATLATNRGGLRT
ncbi:MAG: 4-hydroxythreonine-4-phosphate dehydrogenase PdxA [Anaerolineae bacterium]